MLKHRLWASVCLMWLGLASAASGEVIVFGDSLSDTGNFSLATGGTLPPSPPYFNGHFSNGQVWVEHLAARLGEPAPLPSLLGGTNFAFNGARVIGPSPYGVPDLQTQAFLYLTGHTPQAGDVFAVWGGANDIFFSLTGQVSPITPPEIVDNLSSVIRMLALGGAQEFVVPNLPPLGQTPFFNQTPLAGPLDAAAAQFNALLGPELPALAAELNVEIHLLDVNALFQAVISDPAAFGLTNVTDSATLFDPVTGIGYALNTATPGSFLFFDSVHPTAGVHELIGNQAALQVVPEPASMAVWATLGMAGCGLGWLRRRRTTVRQTPPPQR